jgi:hypothetical protein
VRAVDAAGNTDPTPASSDFIVDTTAPDASITSGPPAQLSTDVARFTLASDDASATFRCSLDGAPWEACDSQVESRDLADGDHSFSAVAVDPAGNVDPTPAVANFQVDADPVPPTIAFLAGAAPSPKSDGSQVITDSTPQLEFAPTNAPSYECRFDDAAFVPCAPEATQRPPTPLEGGSHSFSVRGLTESGRAGGASIASFTVDDAGPQVRIGRPRLVGSRRVAVRFRAKDQTPLITSRCGVDHGPLRACSSPFERRVGPGYHHLRVVATDYFGNASRPARASIRVRR